MRTVLRWMLSISCLLATASASRPAWASADPVLENAQLAITFSQTDGSLSVKVKQTGDVWTQQVASQPYAVGGVLASTGSISATLTRAAESWNVVITLLAGASDFGISVTPTVMKPSVALPAYPYPFTMPTTGGYYVQNTSGDGALFPLSEAGTIQHMNDFIAIPWWGLTDFNKAMMTILESPFMPADTNNETAACTVPIDLRYVFVPQGGYVELARAYRTRFLGQNAGMTTLASKTNKPGLSNFKDGVYTYFWDDAVDGTFMGQLHDAGLEKMIAGYYYGAHNLTDDQLATVYTAAKAKGWTASLYTLPGANLSVVAPGSWTRGLILGNTDPVAFFAAHPDGWDKTCSVFREPTSPSDEVGLAATVGAQSMYFDTYVVQMAPCLDAYHGGTTLAPGHTALLPAPAPLPSSVDATRDARKMFLDTVRAATSAVGSGEGLAPAWAIPHLDFFEGEMELGLYGEIHSQIPAGGYNDDFSAAAPDPGLNVDPSHRIPLFELQFHDYVATTWNWRNTNFQNLGTQPAKDLLNALYGTMPMWNMTKTLWADHQAQFLASYAFQQRARSLVGFDDMIGHGWLSSDRLVQYSDWASGVRIIANFDMQPHDAQGQTIPPMDFVVVGGPGTDGGLISASDGGGVSASDGSVGATPDAGAGVADGSAGVTDGGTATSSHGCSMDRGRAAGWPLGYVAAFGLLLLRRRRRAC